MLNGEQRQRLAPILDTFLPPVPHRTRSRSKIPISLIIECVARFCALTPEEILHGGRTAQTAEARHVAMYLIRGMTELSLTQVANIFHKRDHTTVMYACKRVADRIQDSKQYQTEISGLQNTINHVWASIKESAAELDLVDLIRTLE